MALVWILYSRTANVRTGRAMLMVELKRVQPYGHPEDVPLLLLLPPNVCLS